MTQTLWIPGRLPGMNEIIAAAKSGRGRSNAYSRMKATNTARVVTAATIMRMRQVAKARIKFNWTETNTRRDPDNIVAAQKFVLDGLVAAGVLPGDGWENVVSLSHTWGKGRLSGVSVTIEEVS